MKERQGVKKLSRRLFSSIHESNKRCKPCRTIHVALDCHSPLLMMQMGDEWKIGHVACSVQGRFPGFSTTMLSVVKSQRSFPSFLEPVQVFCTEEEDLHGYIEFPHEGTNQKRGRKKSIYNHITCSWCPLLLAASHQPHMEAGALAGHVYRGYRTRAASTTLRLTIGGSNS